jgi:hypothetical protein
MRIWPICRDMRNCPICRDMYPEGYGSGFYERLTPCQIGWETCKKKSCITEVKARNLRNHEKWSLEEYGGLES